MLLKARKGNIVIHKGQLYDVHIMQRRSTGSIYFRAVIEDNPYIDYKDMDLEDLEFYFGKVE